MLRSQGWLQSGILSHLPLLITDLSSPTGQSVNDGIDRELASVAYMSVDDVVRRIVELGKGALVAKADVRVAYRNIPVHLRDRWLLGMRWKGQVFVDGTLLFGLRSAPLLFTSGTMAISCGQ